jgi:hypothetical protein
MPFDSTKARSPREIADAVAAPRRFLDAERALQLATEKCVAAKREAQAAMTAGGAGEARVTDRAVKLLWDTHDRLQKERARCKANVRAERPAYEGALLAALANGLASRSARMTAGVAGLREDAVWLYQARMAMHLRGGAAPQNIDGLLDELERFAARQGRP